MLETLSSPDQLVISLSHCCWLDPWATYKPVIVGPVGPMGSQWWCRVTNERPVSAGQQPVVGRSEVQSDLGGGCELCCTNRPDLCNYCDSSRPDETNSQPSGQALSGLG